MLPVIAAALQPRIDAELLGGAVKLLLDAGAMRQLARELKDPKTKMRARWLADQWESEARSSLRALVTR